MQLNTDLTGLFGVTLAVIAVFVRVPKIKALPLPKLTGLLAVTLIVLSVPLWGLSLSGFVRGITGDLSVPTLVLLVLALLHSLTGRVAVDARNRHSMLGAVAVAAVLFYPLALGLGVFDPYRLGYGNLWFMAALCGFAIWSSLRHATFLAVCIALAVGAWSAGWYESPNLWDYLLDPWLAIYALVVQAKYWWKRGRGGSNVQFKP